MAKPHSTSRLRDRLAHALSSLRVSHNRPYPLRASVGVVPEAVGVGPPDVMGLLEAADQRMYRHRMSTGTTHVARSSVV